ncbi:hypothetical protein L5M43_11620 [Shewanella sp. SW36]|uniref:hypothetical protein n=1 Tax=unclassified Shewanella TaxID=196818 RepID=UPI0021D9295B|nr:MULTISPECIES: hypothetical protein [unclassified Shewanella]MCU7975900.1 hypothetical protein [Shewanella sp. SW36]
MHKVKAKFFKYLYRFFLGQVVYADKVLFSIALDDQGVDFHKNTIWHECESSTAKIAILSRACYREQLQWYPITKRSDVLNLVRLQLVNANCVVLHVIGNVVNGKTPVTYYYLDNLPDGIQPWLFLPETLLLAQQLKQGELLSYPSVDNSRTLFVANAIGGVVSAFKGGMIQSSLQFALSQGLTITQDRDLTGHEMRALLLTQLYKFYQLPLTGLVNRHNFDSQTTLKKLASMALPAVLVVTLYLVVTEKAANLMVESNAHELAQARVEANNILKQRQDILDMSSRFQLLDKYLPENGQLLKLWQVLAPLYKAGVTFQTIQTTQGKVVLRIETDSASKVLGLLISQPGVSEAQFDSAVRRQGNIDSATISFTLQPNEVS